MPTNKKLLLVALQALALVFVEAVFVPSEADAGCSTDIVVPPGWAICGTCADCWGIVCQAVKSVARLCEGQVTWRYACCDGGTGYFCSEQAPQGVEEGDVVECPCADPATCDLPREPISNGNNGRDDNGNGAIDDPAENPDLDAGTGADGGGGAGTNDPDAGYNNGGPPPDPDSCEGSGPQSVAYAQGNAFIRPVVDFRIRLWGEEYFEFKRGYDSNSGWHSNLPGLIIDKKNERAVFTRPDGRKVFFYWHDTSWVNWTTNYEFSANYGMYRTDQAYTGCPWARNVAMDFEITDDRYSYRYQLAPAPDPGPGNCSFDTLFPMLTAIVDQKTGKKVLKQEWGTIGGDVTKLTFAPESTSVQGGTRKIVCGEVTGGEHVLFGPYDDPTACENDSSRRTKPMVKYLVSGGGHLWLLGGDVRIDRVVHYDGEGRESFQEAFQYKYDDQSGKYLTAHVRGSDAPILIEAFDYYPPDDRPSQRNKVMWQLSDKESVTFSYNDSNTEATVCSAADPSACKRIGYGYNRLVAGKSGAGSCGACGSNELVNAEWSGFQPRLRTYRNKKAVSKEFPGAVEWTWYPPSELRQRDDNDATKVLKTDYWYGTALTHSGIASIESAPLTIAERVYDESQDDSVLKTTIYDYTQDGNCLHDTAWFRNNVSSDSIALPAIGIAVPSCGPASGLLKRIIVEGYDPLDAKYRTRVKEYNYNDDGLLYREIGFSGEITEYTYEPRGVLKEKKRLGSDAAWHVTKYEAYDSFGNPGQVTGEDGVATTYQYDPRGLVVHENRAGSSTIFRYGRHGLLERQIVAYSERIGFGLYGSSRHFIYGILGRVDRIDHEQRSFDPFTQRESFTTLYSVTQEFNDTGNVTKRQYQDAGGTIKKVEVYTFDPWGTMTGVKNTNIEGGRELYTSIETSFDENCHSSVPQKVGKVEKITDELGRIEHKCYDAFDRLVAVVARDGGVTRYQYDAQNNLLAVLDPRGNATTYSYDGFGQLRRVDSPDGGSITYLYDFNGRVIEKTDAKGTLRYCYDLLGNILSVRTSSCESGDTGALATYLYDDQFDGAKTGRLSEINDGSGSTKFVYNAVGDVVEEDRQLNQMGAKVLKTFYEYNLARDITAVTYPAESGGQRYQIDRAAFGRVTSMSGGPIGVANVAYQPFGALRGYEYNNGTVTSVDHYLGGMTKTLNVVHPTRGKILDKGYTLHDTGNIATIDGDESARHTGYTAVERRGLHYGYDNENRLESAEYFQYAAVTPSQWKESFTYFVGGNRQTRTSEDSSGSKNETYDYYLGTNRLQTVNDPVLSNATGFDTSIWTKRAGLNTEFAALLDECKKAGGDLADKRPAIMQCEEALRDKFVELLRKYAIETTMFKTIVMNGRTINGSVQKMLESKNQYLSNGGKILLDAVAFGLYIDELKKMDFAAEVQTLEQVKYGVAAGNGPQTHYLYDGAGNVYAEVVVCIPPDPQKPGETPKPCGILCYDHDVLGRLIGIFLEGRTVSPGESIPENICKSEGDRSKIAGNVYDYKNRRVASTDVTLLFPQPNKYFFYDLGDNLISEVFYGPKNDDEANSYATTLKEYVYLDGMPVAQVVYADTETYTAGGCTPGGCQSSGCSIMGDENAERTNLVILLVFLPLLGAVVVVARRGRFRWWHAAGLAVVAVVFLMGPFKARTFAKGVAFYYHVDHLNTPIKMTDQTGWVVWDVEHKRPFGDFGVQEATVSMNTYTGDSADNRSYTVENPLRFPGQYNDYDYRALIISNGVGPYYNWNRWYSPQVARYGEPEPILSDPDLATLVIEPSLGLHPFVYAINDPLLYSDSDARNPAGVGLGVGVGVGAAGAVAAAGAWAICMLIPECRAAIGDIVDKCRRTTCKVELHGPHHGFGVIGKQCHLQITCWRPGETGSNTIIRIPIPCWLAGK